jgi:hypothetical protein
MSNPYKPKINVGTLREVARSGKDEKNSYVIYQMANKRFVAECFSNKQSRHAFFDTEREARAYVSDFFKETESQ